MRLLLFLALPLIVLSCGQSITPKRTKLVSDLPDLIDLADSLNKLHAPSVKWAINEGRVIYARPVDVDWRKEFEAVLKDSINDVRFNDAYDIENLHEGSRWVVTFTAKSPSQEIQLMRIAVKSGSIVEYEIQKSRSTFFSSSNTSFSFHYGLYELKTRQEITGAFNQRQVVEGRALTKGHLWRGSLDLGGAALPFQFMLNDEKTSLTIINGSEQIGFSDAHVHGDSIYLASDYFNTRFEFKVSGDTLLSGRWVNHHYDVPRILPFTAKLGTPYRFFADSVPAINISGKHKAVFYSPEGNVEDSTVLVLKQNYHQVEGSFLTETGDYRFLEGVVRNDSLYLSTMDGSHAFLFTARINGSTLEGEFRSGNHWRQNWSAELFTEYSLKDPSTLTSGVGGGPVDFSFPDAEGNIISLSDTSYHDKPVVVSVMGTWCPNCLDEAMFLKEIQGEFHKTDLRFIALDFELISDSAQAKRNIQKLKSSVGIDFPVLLASLKSTKKRAGEALPFLSGISSYPTMIVLNRNHEIVKIHTGFSGPATGGVYESFYQEYSELFRDLL